MRCFILIVLVVCATSMVTTKSIPKQNVKRFLGLPSISDIKDRIKARIGKTIGNIQDKIMDTLYAGGDKAYELVEVILTNERIKPYAEKIRTIIYELKDIAEASEYEWQKLRERLLAHIKEVFDMILAEDEVQIVLNKVETLIDDVREAAKSSKEKAAEIRHTLGVYIWAAILTVGAPIDLIFGSLVGI